MEVKRADTRSTSSDPHVKRKILLKNIQKRFIFHQTKQITMISNHFIHCIVFRALARDHSSNCVSVETYILLLNVGLLSIYNYRVETDRAKTSWDFLSIVIGERLIRTAAIESGSPMRLHGSTVTRNRDYQNSLNNCPQSIIHTLGCCAGLSCSSVGHSAQCGGARAHTNNTHYSCILIRPLSLYAMYIHNYIYTWLYIYRTYIYIGNFYMRPVLAFGYCHCPCLCICQCVCVYLSLACPHDNSSAVQARITKFET